MTFQSGICGFQPVSVAFIRKMWHDEHVRKGVYIMTKKSLWLTTGLYVFCAVIWTVNFFLHWNKDGMIEISTALFGVSAILFVIAAVGSVLRLIREYRGTDAAKENK